MNWQTIAIHAGDAHNPSSGVASPIYQSATFQFTEAEEIAAAAHDTAHPLFYGRTATPNTKQVEATLAQFEQGEAALAQASGMAAISLVLTSLLQAGDHVVAQNTLYPATLHLLRRKFAHWGVETTFVDQTDVSAFAQALRPNTRLIYVETPANPTLALTDLAAVAELARPRDILTVADNTFATPYNQQPLTLGIDVVVHSATKYLGGHSDVVAGAIISTQERITHFWENHMLMGGVLHPFEAWLLERGLKTFGLRMARHNENGLKVAQFLAQHPAVAQVHYPGLPSHPQHNLACRQMRGGFSGNVVFELKGGREAGQNLLQRVRLIKMAVSLGGVHSLMTHPASTIAAAQNDEELAAAGITPGLVRLSLGLEESADLLNDLDQALGK